MAGLLDYAKEFYAGGEPYRKGIGGLLSGDTGNVTTQLKQLFDPAYMKQVKPMSMDEAQNLAMMAMTTQGGKIADVLGKKTQYELAHELAQKNAVEMLGLPPNNTAMDRAKALGFDTENTLYHGSGKVFDEFAQNNRGVNFVSPSPEFANKYAGAEYSVDIGDSPNILPTFLKSNKPFDYENKSHIKSLAQKASLGKQAIDQIKNGDWSRIEDRSTLNAIKELGFDGVHVKEQGVKNFAVFDPKNIRSPNAAFDPARANEADLLGMATPEMLGILATGSGAGIAYANNKKKGKK